jgi:poly-gamma-glutamate synthesis protein (capsule biosynthesis protein)
MAHDAVIRSGRRFGEAIGAPYDFGPLGHLAAPVLSRADLSVCHLETTVSVDGAPPTGFPRFRAPFEYVAALGPAGFDACSTASNHSIDYGPDGVVATIDALAQTGLGWAGTARTAEEGAGASMYTAAGVRIAHLSATYGLNGLKLPDDQPWMADLLDVPRLLDEAAAARAAGAEIVVVSVHCCVEYRVQPTDAQVDLFQQLLASPHIDLVVGHHAHVVQPIERIGDEWAIYGLGNILSNMYESTCCPAAAQDGVIVEVEFVEGPAGSFRSERATYTPTWVDRTHGHVITPVVSALADTTLDGSRRAALEASLARTVEAINSRGADTAGVVHTG